MVQQFLHTQLQTKSSSSWRTMALTVVQSFGRGMFTARNIVRWEKSWMSKRKIPKRKEKDDGDSWMYDEDVNDAIKKFIKTQGDCSNAPRSWMILIHGCHCLIHGYLPHP